MLNEKQIEKMLSKLKKFEEKISNMLFDKVGEVEMGRYDTAESLHDIPPAELFTPCRAGDTWGGESSYCWFKGTYRVPEELEGKTLYLYPRIGGYEAMLWVNGMPFGTFCTKIVVTGHGNHYCDMFRQDAAAGERIDLALEYYSGHYVIGCDPWNADGKMDYTFRYDSVDVCVKNQLLNQFYFNLRTVNQMIRGLDHNSYRRADLIRTLTKIHENIYYSVENVERKVFLEQIAAANQLLQEQLAKKNSQTAPFAGLIGHSHMDTAWLWHKGETIKKCARTYSNELNLMEQYPEYKFIQSSAYHGEVIRRHYPQLFEQIRKQAAQGRYEPNGGVWIECDCNITSGESMIRQFLWGQRFTRKYFGYTSNCFWLPDTFGYSASIPQIMKGCHVEYFLTTKMAWNDTTEFPYDTFYWKGIDGTQVFTHLNKTHLWPDPESLMEYVVSGRDSVKEKTVSDKRLLSYGFGDGGGGPQFEMIEMARRITDLEGLPRSEHILVGDFMKLLEDTSENVSVYHGELYLELHRGTLTNQHTIKRNNRLGERQIHNLEFLTVEKAVREREEADSAGIADFLETLLVNQFHDILPGTCIPRAHQESIAETTALIQGTQKEIEKLLASRQDKESANCVTVVNPVSFDRDDVIYLDYREGQRIRGSYLQQITENIHGGRKLAVYGVTVPAYGSVVLEWEKGEVISPSCFIREGESLITPYEKILFDDKGYICSYVDRALNRELCGEGYALNTFLIAEDIPNYWDNWDIDADMEMKLRDSAELLDRRVISDGAVEYRIRSRYRIAERSTILQDMIIHGENRDITFETVMDWQDNHRFLKSAFDVSLHSDEVRQEIQFGCLKRKVSRNTMEEKAKFEVCNHKYTDLSENRYGISILNDCKYGISVKDSEMRLSLHKGGIRPDYHGDKGIHQCTYVFHPHTGGFEAGNVIWPAYELNYPVLTTDGVCEQSSSFVSLDADNVIIETIKPCEDKQNAYILRLYEAEGAYANTTLRFRHPVKELFETDMLEEVIGDCSGSLVFRPFEIKTVKVVYDGDSWLKIV
ncbi:alpha-mannosidase [Anaerotaenia torta]|uniref:alpha-mannosidase n=1 Tax=Anaerotaenia torta TaxID=433293 RepID=UPI003D1D9A10